MTEKNKNTKHFDDSNWWRPSKTENIMLWLTIITVTVSIVSQANSLVGNFLQFNNVYKQLYPFLNILHIYILLYIMSNLRNVKQFIPSPISKENDNYPIFKRKLKAWIMGHFGEIYWKNEVEKKDEEKKPDTSDDNTLTKCARLKEKFKRWRKKSFDRAFWEEIEKKRKEEDRKNIDTYIDKLTTDTNENILKTHKYFLAVFACFILLYVFELINSFTHIIEEPVLHILTIIFNNIATLFWFYIYLTLNVYNTKIKIDYDDRESVKKKRRYKINKKLYSCWRRISLAEDFKRPNKYKKYEEYEKKEDKTEEDRKYQSIQITKFSNWKSYGLLFLIIVTGGLVCFTIYFTSENILEIERAKDVKWVYYLFRATSMGSILLGGCAMLAIFSRLSSGFKKVPLSAFLVMLFYAAMQPLFFAGSEFESSEMKVGQMMFIANLLCLIGKFGLLYLIRWFFGNYHIAYYFIAEQIINDKKDELDIGKRHALNKLFCKGAEDGNMK